jgi:chorismate mutase
LLGRRFAITAEVGRMKASKAMPPVDVEREEAQRREYARLAAGHGVKEELVQALFRSVIEEVVLNHRALREQ